jgi:hypothetical protein
MQSRVTEIDCLGGMNHALFRRRNGEADFSPQKYNIAIRQLSRLQ